MPGRPVKNRGENFGTTAKQEKTKNFLELLKVPSKYETALSIIRKSFTFAGQFPKLCELQECFLFRRPHLLLFPLDGGSIMNGWEHSALNGTVLKYNFFLCSPVLPPLHCRHLPPCPLYYIIYKTLNCETVISFHIRVRRRRGDASS